MSKKPQFSNDLESKKYRVIKSIYKPKSPSIVRRIGAFILDFICFLIIAIGVAYLVSVINGYDSTMNLLNQKYVEHGIMYYDESNQLVQTTGSNEELSILWYNFEQDKEAVELWDLMVDKTLPIPFVGAGVSLLIFELIVPLLLKNGRTIGMYVFKIALISNQEIKITFKNVFIRFLFGKLLVNAFIPIVCILLIYFNMSNIIIVTILMAVLLANLFMAISSKRHITVPDYFGGVFPCDSEEQIFFDTVEQLNAAKGNEAKNVKDYD